MLKQIYILLLFVLAVTGLQAQNGAQQQQQQAEPAYSRKKTLRDVRSNLKAERYAQADEQIQKAWKQSEEAVRDAELYNLMVNAQRGLANAENKKIFLNNRPDTAKYFDYIYKVYDYGIRCDSLDRLPNEKGRVKTHYSSNIQSQLLSYRNNIKSAGKFFYKKHRFSDAYKYFDMYLKTRHHPLLTSAKNYTVGTDTTELAVMAVYASYSAKEYDHVKQYIQLALNDTTESSYLCQLGSQALMELKDTVSAMDYLFEGWKNEPTHDYFFITLVDYNINQHNYQEAYDIVAAQLLEVPDNHRLWYIFGKCQQCMDSIDAAVLSYEKALELNPEDALSYSSLGNIYIEKARGVYNINTYAIGTPEYAEAKQTQDKLYETARNNLEKARKYSPEDSSLWLTPLSEVYFKLNMGKELKALESLESNGSQPKSSEANNSDNQSRGSNNPANQSRGSNNSSNQSRGSNN